VALSVTNARAAVAADINVTPMIDVMLVLLIIFMIVTPAITAGFQAAVPRADYPHAKEEEEGEIRLGIDVAGKYYIDITGADGKYTGMRLVPDNELEGQLRTLYSARSTDKILFLKADENLEFARIQEAIEIARKAGVRVVGTITEQRRGRQAEGEH
jgi:biopolymer transport protein ExbD